MLLEHADHIPPFPGMRLRHKLGSGYEDLNRYVFPW